MKQLNDEYFIEMTNKLTWVLMGPTTVAKRKELIYTYLKEVSRDTRHKCCDAIAVTLQYTGPTADDPEYSGEDSAYREGYLTAKQHAIEECMSLGGKP